MTINHDQVPSEASDLGEIRELTNVVEDLIAMMAAGNIGSLKLEYGELRLSLQSKDRATRAAASVDNGGATPVTASSVMMETNAPSTDHIVTAPMIGTFYVAPAPNEPPFVTPGDQIQEGQTIGIIEAMKIMNEIASDRSGTIVEVLAGDGQTVEYGSPLVRIEPVAG